MNKYKFRKYDKKYPELFRREQIKLRKIIGKRPNIGHIGSTAVPGLGGKGVLDVMISVNRKEINKIKKLLEKANYMFKESGGEKDRLFFKKNYKYCRRIHLHLTPVNSLIQKKPLAVRDYLRKNKKRVVEYTLLKKQAVKFAQGEGKRYRRYKKSFLDKIEKLALREIK